jgi:hypothetical protein
MAPTSFIGRAVFQSGGWSDLALEIFTKKPD